MKRAAQKKAALEFLGPGVGVVYLVRGYYIGDFVGRVEEIDRRVAVLTVLDPLRPHEKGSCPFPQCLGEDYHDGPHSFSTLRVGARVEVRWQLAQFDLPEAKVIEFPVSWETPRGVA